VTIRTTLAAENGATADGPGGDLNDDPALHITVLPLNHNSQRT